MFLVIGRKDGKRVVVLGHELGGAYKGQYNMFGGRHDKRRKRLDTAMAEFCEEFGASVKGAGTQCDTPAKNAILKSKKIIAGLKPVPQGIAKTTIIILWDVGSNVPKRTIWNSNNAKARQNTNIPRSYKEMDKIQIFDLDLLLLVAQKTPKGSASMAYPMSPDQKNAVVVSMFTIQTLKEFHLAKMI